jgi:uncharacterized membrane protein
VLAVGGGIGLTAAAVLLVEKIALIEDPTYLPSCSINPILSCGSVMRTWQAEAFGMPNPVIGVAGFAAVTTVGWMLLAEATLRRWFWMAMQTGVLFGIGFVHWLIFQSLYRIDALCPYCMVVWATMIPVFWYVTLWNLQSSRLDRRRWAQVVLAYHGAALTAWYLAIIALVLVRFWYYWSTLLP